MSWSVVIFHKIVPSFTEFNNMLTFFESITQYIEDSLDICLRKWYDIRAARTNTAFPLHNQQTCISGKYDTAGHISLKGRALSMTVFPATATGASATTATTCSVSGCIHSYETLGAVDGPGLRFVLFVQGCTLRCRYCHNPDSWAINDGTRVTVDDISREVLKYRNYYGSSGGLTVSGGEPLLQLDFLTELFEQMQKNHISTAIDTSGAVYRATDKRYDRLLSLTNLVLLDIKHIDTEACRRLTGHGNEETLAFAERLAADRIPVWIRQVLVPGYTDDEATLRATRQWIDHLPNVEKVEILPYHTLGRAKYEKLRLDYPLGDLPVPTAESIQTAKKILIG